MDNYYSGKRKTDLGKPSKYLREDNPEHSALAEEIERKHVAITVAKHIVLKGHPLVVHPGVFSPEFSLIGDLLVEAMDIQAEEVVLDLGTGTGFQAIVASDRAKGVVAIDKQPEAFRCASKNVELNHMEEKIEVRHGDLFSAVTPTETFDVILFNIPFPPWKPKTPWQDANFDEGHQLLRRFLSQAKSFLKAGGRIGMTWSDLGDTSCLHELLKEEGYSHRIPIERRVKGVGQYVFELRHPVSP
jgi:HemK-related putative methylase